MLGLERIIDKLFEIWEDIVPLFVIMHYDRGVLLRRGLPVRVLEPGLHWKWPFLDSVISTMVKTTTLQLEEQSVTTKDNRTIVIRVILKYEVSDVEKILLEVNSPKEALADMAQSIIRDNIIIRDWVDCNKEDLKNDITTPIKREAKQWGIKVTNVAITTLAESRVFRLINNNG